MRLPLATLRRRPALALSVVAVLAVGIGAATAMFGVVRGVLLRPLPVRDEGRIVVSWMEDRGRSFGHMPIPYRAVGPFAERTRAYEAVAAVDYNGAYPQPLRRTTSAAGGGDDVVRANGTWVGGAFFDVLGVRPVLGRLLGVADDRPNAPPSIVLAERLWRRAFGADPGVVGQTVRWQDRTWTVVGIAPAGFAYPAGAEFWVPIQVSLPGALVDGSKDQAYAMVDVVGRLRPDATLEQARDELTRFARETPRVLMTGIRGGDVRAVSHPLTEIVVGNVRPTLWALAAATALVLLIACANVAALLLIDGAGRQRELAVRSAIGAGRRHLVRQLLAESATLAAAGGVLGALLAAVAVKGVLAVAPPELPRLDEIRVDGVVLAFAVLCATAATVLAGVAPALLLTRRRPESALRAAIAVRRGHLPQHLLAAAQLALALVVLAGAALLGRSLLALQRVDMGFATDRLVIAQLNFPNGVYDDPARYSAVSDALVARVRAIPGVAAASFVNAGPFSGTAGWDAPATAEGQTAAEAARVPMLDFEPAGGTYFETLGIPIVRGRALVAADDRVGAPGVVVVSEAAARAIWPGADPLGRRLKLGPPSGNAPWLTVVGVAKDARYRDFLEPRPAFYVPPRPNELPGLSSIAVRVRGDGLAVVPALRGALREVEPGGVVVGAATMRELMAAPLARPRLAALLLGLFAGAALLLAAVGVYGVMTALVVQRRREIGVRFALGARAGNVLRWLLAYGARVALLGGAAGAVGALAATRLLRAQLFGVAPGDPLALAGAVAGLGVVALVACAAPVWRATRVPPREVLRGE